MFYMIVDNGIIKAVGSTSAELRETDEETYNAVSEMLDTKPSPPDKLHDYRLTVDLVWELFEIEDDGKDIDDDELVSILLEE